MPLELLGLSIFFGFSLGLLAWVMITSFRDVKEEEEEQFEVYSTSPLFKVILPFIQYFGRRFEKLGFFAGFRKGIAKKLMHAGKSLAITPDEFLAFMFLCSFIGGAVAFYFHRMVGIGMPECTLITMLVTFLPFMSLNDRVGKRQKAIRQVLPYTLDLLTLAVEAGLDFTAALNRIGENLKKNPFKDELRMLTRDLTMGKSRPEALRDLEKRIGLDELTSVVTALVQADELGASLGNILRIQSQELQRKRFQRAEKKAMQAPVLMLIPLVLFIFPLVFMIIFTPIILKIIGMSS